MRWSLPLVASLTLLPVGASPADPSAPPPVASEAKAPADAILGRWKPSEGDILATISKGPDGYGGDIVASPEKPALVGKPMFRGLVYDAKRAEWTGEVFAVKKGEFVPAVIRLSSEGFVLTAGKGFLSRKITWTRA